MKSLLPNENFYFILFEKDQVFKCLHPDYDCES